MTRYYVIPQSEEELCELYLHEEWGKLNIPLSVAEEFYAYPFYAKQADRKVELFALLAFRAHGMSAEPLYVSLPKWPELLRAQVKVDPELARKVRYSPVLRNLEERIQLARKEKWPDDFYDQLIRDDEELTKEQFLQVLEEGKLSRYSVHAMSPSKNLALDPDIQDALFEKFEASPKTLRHRMAAIFLWSDENYLRIYELAANDRALVSALAENRWLPEELIWRMVSEHKSFSLKEQIISMTRKKSVLDAFENGSPAVAEAAARRNAFLQEKGLLE